MQCFSSCSSGGDHIDLKTSRKWRKQFWRKKCFYEVTGVAVWNKPGHVWFFSGWHWRGILSSQTWVNCVGLGSASFCLKSSTYCRCVALCQVWGYAIQMLPCICRSSWQPVLEGRGESYTSWGVFLIKEIVAPVPGEVNIGFTPAFFCCAKELPLQNLLLVQDCSGLK